jgi:hypothetical protein
MEGQRRCDSPSMTGPAAPRVWSERIATMTPWSFDSKGVVLPAASTWLGATRTRVWLLRSWSSEGSAALTSDSNIRAVEVVPTRTQQFKLGLSRSHAQALLPRAIICNLRAQGEALLYATAEPRRLALGRLNGIAFPKRPQMCGRRHRSWRTCHDAE